MINFLHKAFDYYKLNDLKKSEFFVRKYLKKKKSDFHALNLLGSIYIKLKKFHLSFDLLNQSIKLEPTFFEAHCNLGVVNNYLNNTQAAIINFEKAIDLNNNYEIAHLNLGISKKLNGNYLEAIESYSRAIKINPNYAEAYCYRGRTYNLIKENQKAVADFNQAIKLNPNYTDAYLNKGIVLLQIGDFKNGWPLYEYRKKLNKNLNIKFSIPEWTGKESLNNKKILIYCEQGIGDAIQFGRYCKLVKSLGAHVSLLATEKLKFILSLVCDVHEIIINQKKIYNFDFQCSIMSLPGFFNTNLKTIPQIRKINLEFIESKINKWKNFIGNNGFKIGICWQGNKNYEDDNIRSFCPSMFENISKISEVRLISLHKKSENKILKNLFSKIKIETLPDDFDENENSFIDCASVLSCVDMAITSDTSITHLSGTLGLKTWIPLSYSSDWRWMLDIDYSPWYPNHKLFRQRSVGNWKGVFDEMEKELIGLVHE